MKRLLLLTVLVSFALLSAAQKKTEKDRSAELLKTVIASKDYKIDVDQVIPQRTSPIRLNYGYNLRVKQDTVISLLPFYGRAYSVAYSTDSGMQFTGTASKYEVKYTKKGAVEILFDVVTSVDRYRFSISISKELMASISITSNRRSPILYLGKLNMDDYVINK